MDKTRLRVALLQVTVIKIEISKTDTSFCHIFFRLRIVLRVVLFLITIKV